MAEQERQHSSVSKGAIRSLMPSGVIWRRLGRFARRKPLGAFGAVIALILIIVAVFAPLIATHDPAATNGALVFAPPGIGVCAGRRPDRS